MHRDVASAIYSTEREVLRGYFTSDPDLWKMVSTATSAAREVFVSGAYIFSPDKNIMRNRTKMFLEVKHGEKRIGNVILMMRDRAFEQGWPLDATRNNATEILAGLVPYSYDKSHDRSGIQDRRAFDGMDVYLSVVLPLELLLGRAIAWEVAPLFLCLATPLSISRAVRRENEPPLRSPILYAIEDFPEMPLAALKDFCNRHPRLYAWFALTFNQPLSDEEMAFLLKDPITSLLRTLYIDGGPSDETRNAASLDPHCSILYALAVDQGPHDVTRSGACKLPDVALEYAIVVDKGPHPETRKAASEAYRVALSYAQSVDRGPHDVTRLGAAKDPRTACDYAVRVDRGPHPVTRRAACQDARMAWWYAQDVDICHRPDVEAAVRKAPSLHRSYLMQFKGATYPEAIVLSDMRSEEKVNSLIKAASDV